MAKAALLERVWDPSIWKEQGRDGKEGGLLHLQGRDLVGSVLPPGKQPAPSLFSH